MFFHFLQQHIGFKKINPELEILDLFLIKLYKKMEKWSLVLKIWKSWYITELLQKLSSWHVSGFHIKIFFVRAQQPKRLLHKSAVTFFFVAAWQKKFALLIFLLSAFFSLTDRPTYKIFIEKMLVYERNVHRKNQSCILNRGEKIAFLLFLHFCLF